MEKFYNLIDLECQVISQNHDLKVDEYSCMYVQWLVCKLVCVCVCVCEGRVWVSYICVCLFVVLTPIHTEGIL